MKSLSVFLLLAARLLAAAETNKLYVTDDGFLFMTRADGEVIMDPRKVEESKSSEESLPAKEFPSGNWGSPTNGFQLSLRFDKQLYEVGDPVIATILLRNVTNATLNYFSSISELGSAVDFQVANGEGAVLLANNERSDFYNVGNRQLAPGTQHKYQARLNGRVDLSKPGKYIVFARYPIAVQPERIFAYSAKVTIEIKDVSSPRSQQE